MRICFHEDVIGHDWSLLHDTQKRTYEWIDEIPEDAWVVGEGSRELLTALTLAGVDLDVQPPPQYVKAVRVASRGYQGYVPWSEVMPQQKWQEWVTTVVDRVSMAARMSGLSYYDDVYLKLQSIMRDLRPACVDVTRLDRYVGLDLPQGVRSRLESFRPKEGGRSGQVVYDPLWTVSGRLVVKSGPEILHLKKDYRDVITSGYEGGKVIQVDYVSLEPRIALCLVDKDVPDDVYDDIQEKVFGGEHTRDVIKFFVLAALYGSGADTVSEQTGLDVEECRLYIPKVRKYFDVQKMRVSLVKECKQRKGKIRNHYGRMIRVPDPKAHKLYNHKVQSDAVDVTILGFFNIIEAIKRLKLKIDPLFLLHDALFLDCHPDAFASIDEVVAAGKKVPGIGVQLPLEISTLSHDDRSPTD